MSVNWSSDFTATGGAHPLDHAATIVSMFRNALAERAQAAALGGTYTAPAAGAYALITSLTAGSDGWWKAARDFVDQVGCQFVRYSNGTGRYSFAGQASIDSNRYTGDPVGGITPRAWPNNSGWTRRFRRRIYTISQAGTDGQRAIFSAQPANIFGAAQFTWYADLTTGPLFNVQVLTPTSEYKYSGKYFDHIAGSWQLSTDQYTEADLVTETGLIRDNTVTGQITHPGDLFTGEWLNELRDAINDLTVTMGANRIQTVGTFFNPLYFTGYVGLNTAVQVSYWVDEELIGAAPVNDPAWPPGGAYAGTLYSGFFGEGNTDAQAQTNFAAALTFASSGTSPAYGPSTPDHFYLGLGRLARNSGPGSVTAQYVYATSFPRITNDDGTLIVGNFPGGGLTRKASFWLVPCPWSSATGQTGVWNDFGDPVSNGVWCQYGATQTNNFDHNTTPIGAPNFNAVWSEKPYDATIRPNTMGGDSTDTGWTWAQLAITCDYEVAGGFTYVRGYSGS